MKVSFQSKSLHVWVVPVAILMACAPSVAQTPAAQQPLTPAQSQRVSSATRFDAKAFEAQATRQIAVIRAAAQRCQGQSIPSPELLQAVKVLGDMLPRSARIQSLSRQADQARQMLSQATNEKEMTQAQATLDELQTQLEQDPQYSQALSVLDAKLNAPAPLSDPESFLSPLPSPIFQPEQTPTRISNATSASNGFNRLQAGDILLWEQRDGNGRLEKITSFFYARTFTHAGIYLGDYGLGGPQGEKLVYEANPGDGVKVYPLGGINGTGRWLQRGRHVAIGRVKNLSLINNVVRLIYRYHAYGDGVTGYNWLFFVPKESTFSGIYCSQLPWLTFQDINLDSNDLSYDLWFAAHFLIFGLASFESAYTTAWTMVAPDELRASTKIDWYYDQINP